MDPMTTSVAGTTRDKLRTLTERGYVVDDRGCITVRGAEYRLTLHGQNQTLRILAPDNKEIAWASLLPLLRPLSAVPRYPAPPPPRMSARQAALHELAAKFAR